MIARRKTPTVWIDKIAIGSDHPIVIQSMTNTPTADVITTTNQIKELADAGSELIRITINDDKAALAVPDIITKLKDNGYNVPIVGDFHYNGHLLLNKYPKTAQLLSKYRINPGNVGASQNKIEHFNTIIQIAKEFAKPIRIGVNWGSIDQSLWTENLQKNTQKTTPLPDKEIMCQTMVQSAIQSATQAIELGLPKEKIILSVKMSDVADVIRVNQLLAAECDFVLHLGLTEAGGGDKGLISSAAALSILLNKGIGDTIRISLTPEPGHPRSREVTACRYLLQSLGARFFKPTIISCPGCGRTSSQYFIELAAEIQKLIDENYQQWKKQNPNVEKLTIAVMGCIVNGPGESKHADIGISLPGNQENPIAPVYIKGKLTAQLKGDNIATQFKQIIQTFITALPDGEYQTTEQGH